MEKALLKHRYSPTYPQNHSCEYEDDIFALWEDLENLSS